LETDLHTANIELRKIYLSQRRKDAKEMINIKSFLASWRLGVRINSLFCDQTGCPFAGGCAYIKLHQKRTAEPQNIESSSGGL